MRRFFFDVCRNGELDRDEIGVEFSDRSAATRAATVALGEMTRDELLNSSGVQLILLVRDDQDDHFFEASMSFQITRTEN